jgi:hypothetical protein
MHPPSPPTTPWTTQIPGESIECREQPDAHAGTFLTETAGETVRMSSLSLPIERKKVSGSHVINSRQLGPCTPTTTTP